MIMSVMLQKKYWWRLIKNRKVVPKEINQNKPHIKCPATQGKGGNWDNNNKFMNLQKQTGQKWANLSRVCSSDVEDYMMDKPEVDFSSLKHKKKRSRIQSISSSNSTTST